MLGGITMRSRQPQEPEALPPGPPAVVAASSPLGQRPQPTARTLDYTLGCRQPLLTQLLQQLARVAAGAPAVHGTERGMQRAANASNVWHSASDSQGAGRRNSVNGSLCLPIHRHGCIAVLDSIHAGWAAVAAALTAVLLLGGTRRS